MSGTLAVSEVQNRAYLDQMLKLWALSQSNPKVFLAELNDNANLISESKKRRELSSAHARNTPALSLDNEHDTDSKHSEAAVKVSNKRANEDPFVDEYISSIDYLVDRITAINNTILSWRDAQSAQLKYRYMNLDKSLVDIASDLKVSYPSIKLIIAKAQNICADSMRIRKSH